MAVPAGPEPVAPLPPAAAVELDPTKVQLGERLFHDARLSRGDAVACASCHRLDRGGGDGRARPPGADGRPLDYNAPTVFNATLNFRLNWRGNYRTLEEQAGAVLLDPRLMGTSWEELLGKLRADPGCRDAFAHTYGEGPEPWQVLDALAGFQRSLLTPGARLDRWLRGERGALTPEEAEGYRPFKDCGCVACHQDANLGGDLFQRFGIFAARAVVPAAISAVPGIISAVRGKDLHLLAHPTEPPGRPAVSPHWMRPAGGNGAATTPREDRAAGAAVGDEKWVRLAVGLAGGIIPEVIQAVAGRREEFALT
jgi:cytochrome c peroxidase